MNEDLKLVATLIIYIGLIPFMIWLYFIHPWYIGKYKKYDCELQKAQRVSRVIWAMVDANTLYNFTDKVDYYYIRKELLEYLIDHIPVQFKKQYERLSQTEIYDEMYLEVRINVIYTLYLVDIEPDVYEAYFKMYPFRNPTYKSIVYEEVKVLKILSEAELIELGLEDYLTKIESKGEKC